MMITRLENLTRGGIYDISFMDFASPIDEPLLKSLLLVIDS